MRDSRILLFDSTFRDVEEAYSVDGVEYLYDLLANKNSVLKFTSKIIGKKNLYQLVARVDFIASYIIVTFRVIKSLFNIIRVKSTKINFSTIGLLACDLVIPRAKSAEIFNSIDAWLLLPYTRFNNIEISHKTISVYSFLSVKDIIYSYILSLKAIGYSHCTNKGLYIRRLYVSFEFFLVRRSLELLSKHTELVFANHKDRWAILCDDSPQVCKILLQHGVESTNYNYPIKLKNITELYTFNSRSYDILLNTILACKPRRHFFKPTIKLALCHSKAKFTILVVSPISPLKYQEEYILSRFQSNDIKIYVKPHYQNKDWSFYENLEQKYNFILIKEQIFPNVDVVVSYESTLVVEYQMHDIEVLTYEEHTLENIVNKIITLKKDKIYLCQR